MEYIRIGSGKKALVMLPGLALKSTLGAGEAIARQYAAFKDYSIYLFDEREGVEEGYSLRDRADHAAADMRALGLEKACVFGASMGGMVGQYLAIDHPELVERLFLSATCSRMNPGAEEVLTRWKAEAASGQTELLIDDLIQSIYSPAVAKAYGPAIREGMGQVSEEEINRFIFLTEAILKVNTYEELDRMTCPVFAVGALGDRVLTARGTEEMAAKLGCAFYLYGEEYGHGVYDEAPDHVERIKAFFEGGE